MQNALALQNPDQTLPGEAIEGARCLFASLVEQHSQLVYRIALAVTRNPQDAEDVVQEAFLQLYRADRWEQIEDAQAYLARLAWRLAVKRKRPRSEIPITEPELLPQLASGAASPEETAIDAQFENWLHVCIDRLPEKLRQPLALAALGELKLVEIAKILGLPEGTVRRRVHTARDAAAAVGETERRNSMREDADQQPDNLDELLDHALASYTPATPRLGLEYRVRARLAVSGEASNRRSFTFWPWVWGAAGALAAAIVLACVLLRAPAPQNPAVARRELPAPAVQVAARPETASTPRFYLRVRQPPRVDAADSVTLREMRAVSHPAPEAPLTTEEKLLLRIATQAGPEEIALLNPEVRAQKEAEQETEFEEFAGQPAGKDGQ